MTRSLATPVQIPLVSANFLADQDAVMSIFAFVAQFIFGGNSTSSDVIGSKTVVGFRLPNLAVAKYIPSTSGMVR
jgi:hypothetical protein